MNNSFTSPAVVIGSTNQTKIVQNAGAKRLNGTELLTRGKVPQLIYFLVDLAQICFYANDGTDTWIGGIGYPIAGSLTVRDSLVPFQGQKFYVIETDTSYTYQGGAWEGGVIEANTLAATVLVLDVPTTLTRGRIHNINVAGDYYLPPNISAVDGNSLNGHLMQWYISRGITASIKSTGSDTFIDNSGNTSTTLSLDAAGFYTAVFKDSQWELYYVSDSFLQNQLDVLVATKLTKASNLSDVADDVEARANLDVFSTDETLEVGCNLIDAQTTGNGLLKTGTSVTGDVVYSADFATDLEAADPSVTDKVISPKNIESAVKAGIGVSEFNHITGLLPQTGEPKFNLTVNVDRTKIDYPEFTVAFNPDPFLQGTSLTVITIPAGTLTLPVTVGTQLNNLKVNNLGVMSFTSTKPDNSTTSEMLLGTVITLNGEVLAVSAVDQVLTVPWLSSSSATLRTSEASISGDKFTPNAGTTGMLDKTASIILFESGNWQASTVSPHKINLAAVNEVTWSYIDQSGVLTSPSQLVNGQYLDDGVTVVGATKYSIQIAYQFSNGLVTVLLGQEIFNTYEEAVNAVNSATLTLPSILSEALEISRWIIKGDQYSGSGTYDLAVSTNFEVYVGSAVSGAAASTTAADIISSNINNTLSTTNLQTQLDELSERTDWGFQALGAGVVTDFNIIVTDSATRTLPPLPQTGIRQRLMAVGGVTAVFNCNGAENITTETLPNDTGFTILPVDNGKVFELVSDGTNWILEDF